MAETGLRLIANFSIRDTGSNLSINQFFGKVAVDMTGAQQQWPDLELRIFRLGSKGRFLQTVNFKQFNHKHQAGMGLV